MFGDGDHGLHLGLSGIKGKREGSNLRAFSVFFPKKKKTPKLAGGKELLPDVLI